METQELNGKADLLRKIEEINDYLITFSQAKKVRDHYEDILNALSILLDIKIDIQEFFEFNPDGAGYRREDTQIADN